MVKILSVVGARPNFMKIAPIADEVRKIPGWQHFLVHSGQHYDELLSGNFFSDLGLPQPNINLQVGSGSHAVQTAEVMRRLEPVLEEVRPDLVIVVGDVNSTLAAALTAVKLGMRVAHVEAGLRSFDSTMPEEINRKLVDAISDLLFVTEASGEANLKHEGVAAEKIFLVGNVMIDTLYRHRELAARSGILNELGMRADGSKTRPFGVLTLHRPSNVDEAVTLSEILAGVGEIARQFPVFFPVHPRTRKNIEEFGLGKFLVRAAGGATTGIVPLAPLGYLDFLALNDQARIVFTDSGGVQEETTALGVPCLTLRKNTERPATIEWGSNRLVGTGAEAIRAAGEAVLSGPHRISRKPPLWDGKAAYRIVQILHRQFEAGRSTP